MKALSLSFMTLFLTACGPVYTGRAPQNQRVAVQAAEKAKASQSHPAFLRKQQNPAGYHFSPSVQALTLCGEDDMQPVNEYQGDLGPSIAFVRSHKGAVAALAKGPPPRLEQVLLGYIDQ